MPGKEDPMRKVSELRGLAVVDVESGTKLGAVDELVVSPEDGRILAVVLKRGLMGGATSYVGASDVHAFGADAITVKGHDVARKEDAVDETIREAHRSTRALVGNKVVTESGALVGTVSDYFVDEESRRVTGIAIGGGLMSSEDAMAADRILSVGPDALIVSDEGGGRRQTDEDPSGPWGRR
jgi:uncharacterized protein YrrD